MPASHRGTLEAGRLPEPQFVTRQGTPPCMQAAKASVVHITTTRPGMQGLGQLLGSPSMPQPQGSGSGFVWDQTNIVTNYHVSSSSSSSS